MAGSRPSAGVGGPTTISLLLFSFSVHVYPAVLHKVAVEVKADRGHVAGGHQRGKELVELPDRWNVL